MKKITHLLIIGFLFATPLFAEEPAYIVAEKNKAEAVSLTNDLQINSKNIEDNDEAMHSEITANYPEINGAALSPHAIQFNQLVLSIVQQEIQRFKKYVKVDHNHMLTLPESIQKNTLQMDYDIDVVKPPKQSIISVRIKIEGYQAGRPHPYHSYRVVNFDFQNGKTLSLADLFKKRVNYLKFLSHFSKEKLSKTIPANWMISQGIAADAKNFKNWTLDADSILITFDEYQVAPYTYGSPEMDVPYAALKTMIAPTAPIASCVNNAKGCASE